jgi:hypothetical protein
VADTTVQINITAADKASSTLKAVKSAMGDMGAAAPQATKAVSGLGDAMKEIGKMVGIASVAAGVYAAVGAIRGAVTSASDLAETVSKVGVVFGTQADAVKKFAETSDSALGMTKNAALAAAGTYGNLFRSMDMTEAASAGMSIGLVQLASDLASFNNMDPSLVLDKLRAGLTGESEPLKSLGVNINETIIKTKALEMGLYSGTGALTASTKATASYALIMEQTKLAQGDFARTSSGLANQQRILSAMMGDLGASIGTKLLPTVTTLVGALIDLLNGPLPALGDFIKNNTGPILAGLAVIVSAQVIPALGTLTSVTIPAAIGALTTFALAFGPVLVAAALVAGGVALVGRAIDEGNAREAQHRDELAKTADRLGEAGNEYRLLKAEIEEIDRWYGNDKTPEVAQHYADLTARVKELEDGLRQATIATLGHGKTQDQEIAGFRNAQQAAQDYGKVIQDVAVATAAAVIDLGGLEAATNTTGESMSDLDIMLANVAAAYEVTGVRAEQAGEKAKKAMADSASAAQAMLGKLSGLTSALADVNKPIGAQPFGGLDFEAQALKVDELKAKLPGLEENLRRVQGISTAKDLNWKFPDPNKIKQLETEIAQTRNEIAQTESKMGDMTAANNNWGNQGSDAINKVKAAWKEMVGAQITDFQMSGQITDEQADAWRKASGIVQTDEEKIGLNITRLMKEIEDKGPDVAQSVTGSVTGIMNSFDGNTSRMSKALQEYWDELIRKARLYGTVVAGLAAGPSPLAPEVPTPEVPTPEPIVIDPGGIQSPALSMSASLSGASWSSSASSASAGVASAESVVSSIQRVLALFAGLSIDPRVKDMADSVSSVVSAFAAGMDALAKLKDYTSPTTSAVDQAFADVLYITGRLIDAGNRFDRALQWEPIRNFGDTANSLLGAFGAGVDALAKLKDYTAPSRSDIDSVVADLIYISGQLIAAAGQWDTEAMVAAKQLAETAGAIGSAIGSMVDPLKSAADFPTFVVGMFGNMTEAMRNLVRGMVWMATYFDDEGLAAASSLATTAGLVGDAMDKVVEPLRKAAAYPVFTVGDFGNITGALFALVQGMAYMEGELVKKGLSLAAAQGMATSVKTVGDALSAIVQPLQDAAEFPLLAEHAFANLAGGIEQMIGVLDSLHTSLGDAVDRTKGFAVDLQDVLSPLQTALSVSSALVDLSRKLAEGEYGITDGLAFLDTATRAMLSQLQVWADGVTTYDREGNQSWSVAPLIISAGMLDLAKNLSAVLSPFSSVISVVSAATDLARKAGEDGFPSLTDALAFVNTATRALLDQLTMWATGGLGDLPTGAPLAITKGMTDLAESLTTALSPFSSVISVVGAASDLANKAGKDGFPTLTEAVAFMNAATRDLLEQLSRWATGQNGAGDPTGAPLLITEAMITLAANLGAVLSPLSTVISVTSAAVDLAAKVADGTVSLDAAMSEIDTATRAWVDKMAGWTSGDDVLTLTPEMVAFADQLDSVLSPMSTAVSALTAIRDYAALARSAAQDIPAQITALAADLRDLVSTMATQLSGLSISEAAQNAADFLTEIVSPIKTWTETVDKVRFYTRPAQGKIFSLAQDVELIVREMTAMVDRLGGIQIVKDAGAVGTALSPISGALTGLLDLFIKIGGWYRPLNFSDSAARFSDDVSAFVGKLASIAVDEDQLQKIKDIGLSLTPAVESFNGMLQIMHQLADYKGLDMGTLDRAMGDMQKWVEAVSHATSWGEWGKNMGLSFIQGITWAVANSPDREELERQLDLLTSGLPLVLTPAGASSSSAAAATSSNQTVSINITGNNFVVRNDGDVQAIAQAIVDRALAGLGVRSAQVATITMPDY